MSFASASGSKFYIGSQTTDATDQQAEFEADSYLQVGEVETIGAFGDEAALVTFTSLADARVRKRKGSKNAGSIQLSCAYDADDAGQDAMEAAEASQLPYNFKVEFNDAEAGETTPSTFYFRGLVMSKNFDGVTNDSIIMRNFTVEIDSAVIEVDPA